jgi:hydroxymethylpyrimidine/phosphomethylpyrimidine kinase
MPPVTLTIAGSDPSGGAGLQADLKTFHQHGMYGMSVVTLLTVQNTSGVQAVRLMEPELVIAQLDAVVGDLPPQAAKTGALGSAATIEAVADRAARFDFPLVVDPVMISKHGSLLLPDEAVEVLRRRLLPRALLATPNRAEAAALAEMEIADVPAMQLAAARIALLGPRHVLVKGGDLEGDAFDVLWSDGQVSRLVAPRINTPHTHGTGCVFSAAATAWLARGESVAAAVAGAKRFISRAIAGNPGLGRGRGPVDMHAET